MCGSTNETTRGSVHTLNGCTCKRQGKEPLVCTRCTRNTWEHVRGIVDGPSGAASRIRTFDPRGGRRETHQNRIHQMSGTMRHPPLFFPRTTMSHPLTTSGRRRSQMRLRPSIWGKKRIRPGTWARSPFGGIFSWWIIASRKGPGWKQVAQSIAVRR